MPSEGATSTTHCGNLPVTLCYNIILGHARMHLRIPSPFPLNIINIIGVGMGLEYSCKTDVFGGIAGWCTEWASGEIISVTLIQLSCRRLV